MKNIFQSSLHLLLVLYLFCGCDVKHDIVLPLVEEGTAYGYDIDECSDLEDFCLDEENGEYVYNTDPIAEFMCSCNWGNIPESIIDSYQLLDLNENSVTYGQYISHGDFIGKVVLYYFPTSDTWGLCKSRFDSLFNLYINQGGPDSNFIIVGIGKNDNNTDIRLPQDTSLPYVKENSDFSIRNSLDVADRDVYFYDEFGQYITKINLNNGFDETEIISIIYNILDQNI